MFTSAHIFFGLESSFIFNKLGWFQKFLITHEKVDSVYSTPGRIISPPDKTEFLLEALESCEDQSKRDSWLKISSDLWIIKYPLHGKVRHKDFYLQGCFFSQESVHWEYQRSERLLMLMARPKVLGFFLLFLNLKKFPPRCSTLQVLVSVLYVELKDEVEPNFPETVHTNFSSKTFH